MSELISTPVEIPHISFSEMSTYLECPYKRKLQYVDRIGRDDGSIFTSFGSALHKICELQFLQIKNDKVINEDWDKIFVNTFKEELKKMSKKEFEEDEIGLIKDMIKQGKILIPQIVPSVLEYFGKDVEIVDCEKLLMENVEGVENYLFKGYLDMILKCGDVWHVIDHKSCGYGWDQRKKNDKMVTYQLTYYKNFLAQNLNIPLDSIHCHFNLLKRTAKSKQVELFETKIGKLKVKNALELLVSVINGIKSGNVKKNRSACNMKYKCPFFGTEHCK